MKFNMVTGIVIIVLLFSRSAESQWVSASGADREIAWTAVWSIIANDTIIFVGTSNGVYHSRDEGQTWVPSEAGLADPELPPFDYFIIPIAIDTNDDGQVYMYAGTLTSSGNRGGVFLSTNSGVTWRLTGLESVIVRSLLVNEHRVFAGTQSSGIFSSEDNGDNWTRLDSVLTSVFALVLCDTSLLAATRQGVFVSQDDGQTWMHANNGFDSHVTSFGVFSLLAVADAAGDKTIFAGTNSGRGVYRSNDNGTSWTPVDFGLRNSGFYALAASKTKLFSGNFHGDVFVSLNNGNRWALANTGLEAAHVFTLCVHGDALLAGTSSGLWRRPISEITTDVGSKSTYVPSTFSLDQNHPNPFNQSTIISFTTDHSTEVSLGVYDVTGRKIETLVNRTFQPGRYVLGWNAFGFPSGVYYYKLDAGGQSITKTMVLIK